MSGCVFVRVGWGVGNSGRFWHYGELYGMTQEFLNLGADGVCIRDLKLLTQSYNRTVSDSDISGQITFSQ